MHPRKLLYLLPIYSTLCHAIASPSHRQAGLRRLDEDLDIDTALNLANYSIKFESCRELYPAAVAEMEEDGGVIRERRRLEQSEEEQGLFSVISPITIRRTVVTYRMCPADLRSCDQTCATENRQTFDVDLETYLDAMLDYKWEAQEQYCIECNECLGQEEETLPNLDVMNGAGVDNLALGKRKCASIDTDSCYDECQNIENMETNGYFDAAEFTECQLIDHNNSTNQKYYAGATCNNDGSRIKIGVFLDQRCTIPDETKEVENFLKNEDGLAMKLSHSVLKQTYDTSGQCVATCLQNGNNEDFTQGSNQPEINAVCESLYYASSLQNQNQYYDDSTINNMSPTPDPTSPKPSTQQPSFIPTPYFDDDAGWDWGGNYSPGNAFPPVPGEQIFLANYTVREHDALVTFYRNAARGDSWERKDQWLTDSPVCEWYGVSCNEGGSVTSLQLNGNSLQGYFEGNAIGGLGNLTKLDLGNNELYGSISEEVGYLWKLTHVDLANNELGPSIPSSFAWLPQLESLELQGNQFTYGQINNGYKSLRKLTLGDNLITGTIQYDIARLNLLEHVSLRNNKLIGGLADYSLLTELTYFDVSGNMISGTISERAFSENPKLEVLDLSFNQLEGSIPNFGVDVLNINVTGNMFKGIASEACDGTTSQFGCDGVVCPPGFSNAQGRQTSNDTPCEPCLEASQAPYFGTVGCNEGAHDNDDEEEKLNHYEEEDCSLECYNGGVCSISLQKVPYCFCPPVFTGVQCERPLQTSPSWQAPRPSFLQVIFPQYLTRKGGYNHEVALFGPPTYNISANVYYADSDLCDGNVDTSKGYPIRETFADGTMAPWSSPFLLMVDRGQCTFVAKVRHAQNVGALAVIIADNTCQCDSVELCMAEPNQDCEVRRPILADDGSAEDIVIPSILLHKPDADLIKSEVRANNDVVMEMASSQQFLNGDRVEYELWVSPIDIRSRDFLIQFMESAKALGRHAHFAPRIFIHDGYVAGCINDNGENVCEGLCINAGRYCAADPYKEELDDGVSGPNILQESLRWLCIWDEYGSRDGVGAEWWDYVSLFSQECANNGLFTDEECDKNVAMEKANISPQLINQCMENLGGLEDDVSNKFLDEQLTEIQKQGVTTVPTLIVNKRPVIWDYDSASALKVICVAYTDGITPPVCQMNTGISPTRPPSSMLLPTPDEDINGVIGYLDLGRGSCRDGSGKGYSYLQKTATLPTAALCARQECDEFRDMESYRGFEYSVVKRCTCLFDMGGMPEIDVATELTQYISNDDEGYGVVAGTSGTPGATCYKVIPPALINTTEQVTTLPSASLNYTSNVTGTEAKSSAEPSSLPSSTPSFTPSSTPPTQAPTSSPEPILDYSSSAKSVAPCWQALLIILSLRLSIFRHAY